jgi:thioredoxin-like negative regulator of GroEL
MSANAPANAVMTTAPDGAPPKPSLLFFFDPRSGRSRRVDGFLAQVLQHRRNHDTFHLYRIDVTQHPDLATKFKVGTVPTLVVVENKQAKARFQQPRGARELTRFLQPWLR